ncbi:MAG: hypothetical protein ACRD98_00350 [Nitrososphaera sp.]
MPDSVLINGVAVTDANFNDTAPVASAGRELLLWQLDTAATPDNVSVQTSANIPIVLDREVTDLTATTVAETVIFSHSIPANAMGTNRSLELILIGSVLCNTTSSACTFRVKFGGTTIFEDATGAYVLDVDEKALYIHLILTNQGVTNDQTGGGVFFPQMVALATAPTVGIAGDLADAAADGSPIVFANSAIDTTLAKLFEVTWAWATAGANNIMTRRLAILKLN